LRLSIFGRWVTLRSAQLIKDGCDPPSVQVSSGEERSARRESDEEERDGCGTCKDDSQAAGENVIGVHDLAFISLAVSPLCFVNDQMGTCVLDEHC